MGVEVSYTELCLILRAITKEIEKVKELLKEDDKGGILLEYEEEGGEMKNKLYFVVPFLILVLIFSSGFLTSCC
ncbi:hypothetical protein ES702_05470 [subsurface metagenome]